GDVAVGRKGRVGHAEPTPEDGLRIDLISNAETRPDRIGISIGEQAVAAPGPVALIFDAARKVVDHRIRGRWPELGPAVVNFVAPALHVPAQTVVERQPVGDFPGVLKKEAPSWPAKLRILRTVDIRVIDL